MTLTTNRRVGLRFQPLTDIRQTGIKRAPDGSVTYRFVARVSPDLPPVRLTLDVTPHAALSVGAEFDEQARRAMEPRDDHGRDDGQLVLPMEPPP